MVVAKHSPREDYITAVAEAAVDSPKEAVELRAETH